VLSCPVLSAFLLHETRVMVLQVANFSSDAIRTVQMQGNAPLETE
jgi:hypothetical protein